MKPLIQEIQDVLTPSNNLGLIQDDLLYQLQPILPISQIIEIGEDLDKEGQQKILEFLKDPNTVIFNGVVYLKNKGLNVKGRLQEIMTLYHLQLKSILGEKKALIDLYDSIPVSDIINLIEDHVIFVMKKLYNSSNKGLAAIRYVPDYDVHFEGHIYRFPSCMVAIYIDDSLALDNPEVISQKKYEHPFVFRDIYRFGQKICMGSFNSSSDKMIFNRLRFANNVNNLLKQAVQILISGYNRKVHPANGHLTADHFKKYIIK